MAGAEASSAAPSATPEIMPVAQRDDVLAHQRDGQRPRVRRARARPPPCRSTATTTHSASATSDSTTLASSLAASTRGRRGTRAKVVIAVRCDHSELTSRIPTIGSRMLAGATAIDSIERSVWSSGRANRARGRDDDDGEHDDRQLQPEARAGVGHLAQLDGGQPAEAGARVGAARERCGEGRGVHRAISRRSGPAGRRSGAPPVRSKKSCSSPAPSAGPEAGERDAAGERGAPDGLGVGVDDEAAVGGLARVQAGVAQRGGERRRVGRGHERAGVGQQLVAAALGDDAPRADDHDPVGDGLDLVRAGARRAAPCRRGRRSRAAARASSASPRGPGRWPARRGSGPRGRRAARARARGAGACPASTGARACAPPSDRARRARAGRRRAARRTPMVCAETASVSRPRRPGCCAEASSRTPTRRPGLGRSR